MSETAHVQTACMLKYHFQTVEHPLLQTLSLHAQCELLFFPLQHISGCEVLFGLPACRILQIT
jgi:hypothetical protein